MLPVVNRAKLKNPVDFNRADTAFYIFDTLTQLPFSVSVLHHRMYTGAKDDPIFDMDDDRVLENSKNMLKIQAPVIRAVDYYIEGASLDISFEVMSTMYDRITNHLEAHALAMRTNAGYYIGDTFQVFEHLVEFATSIYGRVKYYKEGNKQLDPSDPMSSFLGGRANFMTLFNRKTEPDPDLNQPKHLVCPLEGLLDRMRLYYESSQSWR